MSEIKLTIPHLRVLEVLYNSGGLLSRSRIAERIDKESTYVGRVIGYSDPVKRAAFRETALGKSVGIPLLDHKFVREKELDIDGLKEIVVQITEEGEKAYLQNKNRLREFQCKSTTKEREKTVTVISPLEEENTEEDSYPLDPMCSFEQVTE